MSSNSEEGPDIHFSVRKNDKAMSRKAYSREVEQRNRNDTAFAEL